MTITCRPGTPGDAAWIAEQDRLFIKELREQGVNGVQDHCLTAEKIKVHAFGPIPRFHILLAEMAKKEAGYVLYHWGYETSHAAPGIELIDIFVPYPLRRRGIARAMMETLQNLSRMEGGLWIKWRYDVPNTKAISFYKTLGTDLSSEQRLAYLWLGEGDAP